MSTPTDLITMSEAEKLVNKSRTWIRERVTVYDTEGRDKVSREAVLAALEDFRTPKPKPRKERQ